MALTGKSGEHKMLLVNKRDREIDLKPGQATKQIERVDQQTAGDPPKTDQMTADTVHLSGYEVAAVGIE